MFFPTSTSAMSIERDLEGGTGIEPLGQNGFRDRIRVLENFLVGVRRADGGDDSLPDPCQNRFLASATHQAIDVRPYGHPGLRDELDAVLRHGGHLGRVDHFRVH